MTTGPKFQIEVGTFGEHRLVTVKGEVDMASAPELQAAITDEATSIVLVDLSEVGFMDSTGLRALLVGRDQLSDSGGTLRLVYDDGPVQRIIDLTGLADRFEIFDTTAAAAQGPA